MRMAAEVSGGSAVGGALILALGLWAVTQLRRWKAGNELQKRFLDRLTERNRLASELQDNFLQSLQASKMLADQAKSDESADPAALRATMNTISSWLEMAISEGQSALNALRSSVSLRNDLADAFHRAAQLSGLSSQKEFLLAVEGGVKDLHPIVRDEVYRLGSDAIREAHLRSEGRGLKVRIDYGRDLMVSISEIGGTGSQPFNVPKMQERAGRVGGRLRVKRRPASGIEIVLSVPGRAAYAGEGDPQPPRGVE